MRASQTFNHRLQIEIEGRPDGTVQSWISRHDCVNKMRRKSRRICASDFRWLRNELFLIAVDKTKLNQPRKRPGVFASCLFWMSPRIQARRRLGQASQKNRFA